MSESYNGLKAAVEEVLALVSTYEHPGGLFQGPAQQIREAVERGLDVGRAEEAAAQAERAAWAVTQDLAAQKVHKKMLAKRARRAEVGPWTVKFRNQTWTALLKKAAVVHVCSNFTAHSLVHTPEIDPGSMYATLTQWNRVYAYRSFPTRIMLCAECFELYAKRVEKVKP